MINVKVDFSSIKIDFQLERRISFIKGNSGVGKTLLCNVLGSMDYLMYTKVSPTDYKIIVANSGTISAVIKAETNAIVFADDLSSVENSDFASLCSEYLVSNNLYLVLIVRSRTRFDSELNTSFSIDCIYEMVKLSGIERALIPYYNFPDLYNTNYIDCVLTEDKTAGKQFFEKLYDGKSVFSAKSGKSTIIQDI